jgi:molybdate transport system regulatory protein
MRKRDAGAIEMRIRIYAGDRMLGPDKMELLGHIKATGSLAAAAKKMGMSYMRAWTLVQELNGDRDRPMIKTSRGGAGGGAAKVTSFGRRVLTLYQNMEGAGRKAATATSSNRLRTTRSRPVPASHRACESCVWLSAARD